MRFFIDPEQVARQTTQNLIDAGCLTDKEAKDFLTTLNKLDMKELFGILMESHQLKEEHKAGDSFRSYPIDYLSISEN
jgi:hypothetical protein